jgi:hypothetical protein
MTPGQCRPARALLDMSKGQLTRAAVVPRHVVEDFEAGAGAEDPAHLEAIQQALERAGVDFSDGSARGCGSGRGD